MSGELNTMIMFARLVDVIAELPLDGMHAAGADPATLARLQQIGVDAHIQRELVEAIDHARKMVAAMHRHRAAVASECAARLAGRLQ